MTNGKLALTVDDVETRIDQIKALLIGLIKDIDDAVPLDLDTISTPEEIEIRPYTDSFLDNDHEPADGLERILELLPERWSPSGEDNWEGILLPAKDQRERKAKGEVQ